MQQSHVFQVWKRFIVLSFAATTLAFASALARADVLDPTQLGPYKTGYSNVVITDLTRNRDGSSGTQGRPLYIQFWYPAASCAGCSQAQYSINNPIYDGTHEGYPAIFEQAFDSSPTGTLAGATTASGTFPLLIFSHGNGGAAADNPQLKEILASHGYIVAAIEHTGNSAIRNIALDLGLSCSGGVTPCNPGLGSGITRYLYRAQDVNFVISQLLSLAVAPDVTTHIDPNEVGIYGYSRGGATAFISASGVANQTGTVHLPPDLRIKAVVDMDGDISNRLTGLVASDFPNLTVPTLLWADGSGGQNAYVLPRLVNSPEKYYVDRAGASHDINAFDVCNHFGSRISLVQASPGDPVILDDVQALVRSETPNFYDFCDRSIFAGISDQTLSNVGFDPNEVASLEPLMPVRKQVPVSEIYRLERWYVVSFFNKELKHQDGYDSFLSNSISNQAQNPLIDFHKNCVSVPDHPMDLQSGDKITYEPSGGQYKVTFSKGNALLDKGTNKLILFDDDYAGVDLPFSYPVPGNGQQRPKIWVGSNGVITSLVPPTIGSGDGQTSPWANRGDMLLSGQLTIGASMLDLDPFANPNGGIYAKVESKRVIVTYDAVYPFFTTAQVTIQVVIYKSGMIEITIGNPPTSGSIGSPKNLGAIGIAFGNSRASDLRVINPVDLSSFTKTKKMSPEGIWEQFYQSNGVSSCPE